MSDPAHIRHEQIHTDLGKRAVVYGGLGEWHPTPMPGVERRYLERDGGEKARRATTIVRYAPGSRYSAHTHAGGEEFLVLEGVFSDEAGDYPAGSYVRNPRGSYHEPFSREGCVIFVKLCQIDPRDTRRVCITPDQYSWNREGANGALVMPLHAHGTEEVRLERWPPRASQPRHRHPGGEEILVLEGSFRDEHGAYPAGSWLRNPPLSEHTPLHQEGCLLYVKRGHLRPAGPQ